MNARHILMAMACAVTSPAWAPAQAGGDQTLRRGSDASANTPSPGIDIWVFLHDTAGEVDHFRFFDRYAGWWMEDMRTRVTPGTPLRVHVYSQVPGLTDMDYHTGSHAERMEAIRLRGGRYAESLGASVDPLTRFVLFVGPPAANWEPGWRGVASEFHRAAIASNQGPLHVLAHEIGHLFGARHEYAVRQPCVTNMGTNADAAPCWRYSDANAERIRAYVQAVTGG